MVHGASSFINMPTLMGRSWTTQPTCYSRITVQTISVVIKRTPTATAPLLMAKQHIG